MKKEYLSPEFKTFNLKTAEFILASLEEEEPGGSGGMTPSTPPGWGDLDGDEY